MDTKTDFFFLLQFLKTSVLESLLSDLKVYLLLSALQMIY